ncbi:hypothetical protein BGW80DRAFT_1348347 [Lactifluus volemus]|nr:hypothetical protein BGW80DRAFT_1348347 [Lactifluus volemus]
MVELSNVCSLSPVLALINTTSATPPGSWLCYIDLRCVYLLTPLCRSSLVSSCLRLLTTPRITFYIGLRPVLLSLP